MVTLDASKKKLMVTTKCRKKIQIGKNHDQFDHRPFFFFAIAR